MTTNRADSADRVKQDQTKKPKRRSKRPAYDLSKKFFHKVIVEPFEIQQPKEFKEMNNTRKVDYPMMLQKYNIRRVSAWNLHDFREAMFLIVKKDNDDIFNE